MPPHVLVNFVVFPPGHGRSVTDFWGWDAQEARLRCPNDVSGDILSQLDPVHTPTSFFLKSHLNTLLPSMPGSPKWSLSLRFPHENPVYDSSVPHTHYMTRPYHSSRLYHPHNIGWIHIIKLLIMYFSPLPCHFVPLRPKYSPQHAILKHSPYSS